METKKGYHLLIMLAILVAHTLILSLWLSKSESIQKQANFKIENQKEKAMTSSVRKFKSTSAKDSLDVAQTIFTTSFGISAK